MANYQRKNTGQLSIVPWIANLLGSAIRLYTTRKQLGGNIVMQLNFILSMIINGLIAGQILVYGGSRNTLAE